MAAYYNEIDPYAAQWLRNLIKAGHIANGEVDTRSIVDVAPDDLRGFTQAHFFAGIGGWSHALRLAGWPDDRPIWTGSCPCQPFSVAGKGAGIDDPRHLWPHFFRLIAAVRPPVVMGEQVAGAAGYGWLDGVRFDLEAEGYACRGVDIPACAVDAPHIRSRLYWVASDLGDANNTRLEGQLRHGDGGSRREGEARPVAASGGSHMADAECRGRKGGAIPTANEAAVIITQNGAGSSGPRHMADAVRSTGQQNAGSTFGNEASDGREGWDAQQPDGHNRLASHGKSYWSNAIWLTGADGKARRAQPGIPLLAHGIPNRVGKLRAYGNAIVAPLAAQVIGAYLDAEKPCGGCAEVAEVDA
jgi:DNA (cytosine-5)-methyltransferase 1